MRFRTTVTDMRRTSSGVTATLSDGSTVDTDVVLVATGRRPSTPVSYTHLRAHET